MKIQNINSQLLIPFSFDYGFNNDNYNDNYDNNTNRCHTINFNLSPYISKKNNNLINHMNYKNHNKERILNIHNFYLPTKKNLVFILENCNNRFNNINRLLDFYMADHINKNKSCMQNITCNSAINSCVIGLFQEVSVNIYENLKKTLRYLHNDDYKNYIHFTRNAGYARFSDGTYGKKETTWGTMVILPHFVKFSHCITPNYKNNNFISIRNGGNELGNRSTQWIFFEFYGREYAIISIHFSNNRYKSKLLFESIFKEGNIYYKEGYNVFIGGDFNMTPFDIRKYQDKLGAFKAVKESFDTSDKRKITHININPNQEYFADMIDHGFFAFHDFEKYSYSIKGISGQNKHRIEINKRKFIFNSNSNSKKSDHAIIYHKFFY